jgi:hypothetical protein
MKTNEQTTIKNNNSKNELKSQQKDQEKGLRQQYLTEKIRIEHDLGALEDIRLKLGLSQRRMCQLLLVDPSAWTRWMKTGAPPHIYKALSWLMELQQLNPHVTAPNDMAKRIDYVKATTDAKIRELEGQVSTLERVVATAAISASPVMPQPDHSYALDIELKIKTAVAQIAEKYQEQLFELQNKLDLLKQQKSKPARVQRKKKKQLNRPIAKIHAKKKITKVKNKRSKQSRKVKPKSKRTLRAKLRGKKAKRA